MTTAQDKRNEASAHFAEADASFERCDTDGFMSQWASGLNGRKAQMEAQLIEDDGMANFAGLFEGQRRVAAKIIETQYGYCWILEDEEAARFGRKFIPLGAKSKIQKNLGLREDDEQAPAKVVYRGSNVCTVMPVFERTDGGYPGARK